MERGKSPTPRPRKIISLPMDAGFFYEKAVQSLDRLHYDKALKYFKRAVEFEPDNPVNYYNMAGILSEMGHFEESNEVLRQMLNMFDSGMTECYFYMANNYANMEMFEQAEQAIVRYLEEDPDGYYLEESEEMLEYLSYELERPARIRKIKCREDLFEHDRARMMLEEGQFREAARLLEKLVRKKPDFTAARNNLALAYYYLGRFDRCLGEIRAVLEQDEGNLHALCNLALALKQLGQEERLARLRSLLCKLVPYHQEHLFKLATTLGFLGEHEAAYRHFKRLAACQPLDEPSLYHYCAAAAFNTGRYGAAERYWRKAEELEPGECGVARFYLNELASMEDPAEAGLLNYQYLLPFEADIHSGHAGTPGDEAVRRNPLVRSSIIWALRHGDDGAKLKAFKAVGVARDPMLEDALRQFLLEPGESDYLKKVAVFVLRSMGVKDQLDVALEGKRQVIRTEALAVNLPVWSEKWQMVLEMALAQMKNRYDMVQQHDLQTLWVEYLSRVYPNPPRMIKLNGWAAALEYLIAKMHRRTVSYRDVADRYAVSVTTVRAIVERIDEVCGLRDKMKAIFPQYGKNF